MYLVRNSAAGLALTATFAACFSATASYDSFAVPIDSLIDSNPTIVVAPVSSPDELTIPGDAAARLESGLEEILEVVGFPVVPAFEYVGIWQHILNEVGGLYDEHTGRLDKASFELASHRLRSDLSERFQVDAILTPELWLGAAPFFDGVARWDGIAQEIYGARGLNGEVQALSLVVSIDDLSGRNLYENGVGFATIEAWHHDGWLPLDLSAVVGDSESIANAVSRVLAPILEAATADSNSAT